MSNRSYIVGGYVLPSSTLSVLPLTSHHSPLTTRYSLLTTHYSPPTAHHLILTTHYSPPTAPYLQGLGVKKSTAEAVMWWRRGAELGSHACQSDLVSNRDRHALPYACACVAISCSPALGTVPCHYPWGLCRAYPNVCRVTVRLVPATCQWGIGCFEFSITEVGFLHATPSFCC